MTPLQSTLLSAAVLAALSATAVAEKSAISSSSDKSTEYGEVQGWTIFADAETRSCLAERVYDTSNVMQMGVAKDHDYAYVGIFTLADIDVKKKQDIAIAVDGTVFVGQSEGMKSKKLRGDYKGGYVLTNNPNMVKAIAEGRELVAFPDAPIAFVIDLTSTKRAIEEYRKCNTELVG